MTFYKIERGNATVSIAAYATVLFILGMIHRFSEIADPKFDEVGMALEEEQLPKRIRSQSWLLNRKRAVENRP